MKKIISSLVLMLLLSVTFGSFTQVEPVFRGNKFGISKSQIQEDSMLISEEGNYKSYYGDWKEHQVLIIYSFYNGKLYAGNYVISESDAVEEMLEVIFATYGQGKEQSDGAYLWFSTDKKTVLRVEVGEGSSGAYLSVRVVDIDTNMKAHEDERRAKVRKL